jgi:hypothetical protein
MGLGRGFHADKTELPLQLASAHSLGDPGIYGLSDLRQQRRPGVGKVNSPVPEIEQEEPLVLRRVDLGKTPILPDRRTGKREQGYPFLHPERRTNRFQLGLDCPVQSPYLNDIRVEGGLIEVAEFFVH